MRNHKFIAKVSFEVSFILSESEARALDALIGYSENDFLNVFYEKLGRAYLEPHEAGFRTLVSGVRDIIKPQLATIDNARKLIDKMNE